MADQILLVLCFTSVVVNYAILYFGMKRRSWALASSMRMALDSKWRREKLTDNGLYAFNLFRLAWCVLSIGFLILWYLTA